MRILVSLARHVLANLLEVLLMRKSEDSLIIGPGDDHGERYVTDDVPPVGMRVEVIGYVGSARHVIPFLCCWTDEGWVVAGSRRKLAFNIAGWRRAGV